METVRQFLVRTFNQPSLSVDLAAAIAAFGRGVLVALVIYALYALVRVLVSRLIRTFQLEKTIVNFLLMALRYAAIIVGIVAVLDQFGVNVGSLIAGLGIAGIAIGFAAKDTLSNIIAGIFIFWDRPFYIGDVVEIQGEYGEVKEITLRTTRVVTPDGKMVSIPNQIIAANKIVSYTMFPTLRLDMPVTIGVTEPIAPARKALLAIVEDDDRFTDSPQPEVLVTKLGDYFVELELRVWVKNVLSHIPVRAELRERIKDSLDAAGIEMPFETIAIVREKNQ